MALIALKQPAAWDSVPAGLIASGDTIALGPGAGGWDANSLDMTVLPSSPWASSGGQLASVIDGKLLEINDTSNADLRFFTLPSPAWNEDLSVGLTAYFKIRECVNSGGTFGVSVGFRDGSRQYDFKFLEDGRLQIVASSTVTYDTCQYEYHELFLSVNAGVASVWIWNTITKIWDVVATGLNTLASGSDNLIFGSRQTSGFGRGFYDFINWKSVIESTPFRTDSPIAEMGVIAVANEITAWPVVSGLLGQKYDIGAGFVQPGTGSDAEMASALIGLSPATLNYRVPFASDGVTPASLDINGGVIACIGGACDYAPAGDLRLGVTQDSGSIVGTLIVPPTGDVIEGIQTDDTVGTYKEVPENKAEFDFDYGADGTEFTGTLSPFQATYELPQEVIIEDEEFVIFEGCD